MQVFEKCTIDRGRSKEDCFEGVVSHGVCGQRDEYFAERQRDERTMQRVVIHNNDSSLRMVNGASPEAKGHGNLERLTRGEGKRHREPGGSADFQISVQGRGVDLQGPKEKKSRDQTRRLDGNGGTVEVVVVAVR